MTEMESPEVLMARFEEIGALEAEFEDVELEISELLGHSEVFLQSLALTMYSP